MKQSTQPKFEILFTSSMPSGYGHCKVTVELLDDMLRRETFTATTTLVDEVEEARHLLNIGELTVAEKNQRLFDIIELSIEDRLNEWLEEDDQDENF